LLVPHELTGIWRVFQRKVFSTKTKKELSSFAAYSVHTILIIDIDKSINCSFITAISLFLNMRLTKIKSHEK